MSSAVTECICVQSGVQTGTNSSGISSRGSVSFHADHPVDPNIPHVSPSTSPTKVTYPAMEHLSMEMDDCSLDDSGCIKRSPRRSVSSVSARSAVSTQSDSDFMDVPLENGHMVLNTFAPRPSLAPVKPEGLIDGTQSYRNFLHKEESTPTKLGYKLFGKVITGVLPFNDWHHPKQDSLIMQSLSRKQVQAESMSFSTTGLIPGTRPSNLPPKTAAEEQHHRKEYERMISRARKKEQLDLNARLARIEQQRKQDDEMGFLVEFWKVVLSKWDLMKCSKRLRELWWKGIPPCHRGHAWKLAIGNSLNITLDTFRQLCLQAVDKIMQHKSPIGSQSVFDCNSTGDASGGDTASSAPPACLPTPTRDPQAPSLQASAFGVSGTHDAIAPSYPWLSGPITGYENVVGLINLDVSRTFPQLKIFQKGGPFYDSLCYILVSYNCYRPDVGYSQGMSFLGAVLLLNMELADAFVCFANLVQRPCLQSFFTVNSSMMNRYYTVFNILLEENIPNLYYHFLQESLTPDLYLLDWILTMYSRSLPLDVSSHVWDVYLRDGESFLFRTALGILKLFESSLLNMEFFSLAQFLTKLPDSSMVPALFESIRAIELSEEYFQAVLEEKLS